MTNLINQLIMFCINLYTKKKLIGKEESYKMGEPVKAKPSNTHAIILWIVGIILLIAGIAVATVHGTHLRGTGLGTILIVIGVVAFIIGLLRYFYKPQQ